MKYTYKHHSEARLKTARRLSYSQGTKGGEFTAALITEVLDLRRQTEYWRSLTHVSLGGRRI